MNTIISQPIKHPVYSSIFVDQLGFIYDVEYGGHKFKQIVTASNLIEEMPDGWFRITTEYADPEQKESVRFINSRYVVSKTV